MVKGVIFDMDGLMFDTERLWDTCGNPPVRRWGWPCRRIPRLSTPAGGGLAGQFLVDHVKEYFPDADPRRILDKVWQIGTERFARGVPCKPGLKELLALLESRGMPRIVAALSQSGT